jgi:hypothetical protein
MAAEWLLPNSATTTQPGGIWVPEQVQGGVADDNGSGGLVAQRLWE